MEHIELTDPTALRAYAHPVRMQLVGLLRREGPLTATRAAALSGESVASCSYHLRQLAKYGLVEVDPAASGREKPWRATADVTSWPAYSPDPAVAAAARDLGISIVEFYFRSAADWLRRRADEPREWQEAGDISDSVLLLTPEEMTRLTARIEKLLEPYERRNKDRRRRPEGSRPVQYVRMALPR